MPSNGWQSLMEAFHNAAIDSGEWYWALERLAGATGSRCGQLLGIGSIGGDAIRASFNIVTNVSDEDLERFEAAGGHDPTFNPRVRAGMSAPVLRVLSEADFFASRDEHRRHPHYRQFAEPCDLPFSCLVSLERREGLLIGLAVLRARRQGPVTDEQRAVFTAVAPHVRAAVRTQMALEGQSGALLAGVLEALSIPAFLCDRGGLVKAVTPAAERLLEGAAELQLRSGRLLLPRPEDTGRLAEAIDAAAELAGARRRMFQTVIVRGSSPLRPLVLDVIALPAREYALSFAPRVLVTAGGSERAQRRSMAVLRAAYSLTDAETDIAARLSAGESPTTIAAGRAVAVGTVRAQIKTLLAKLGVKRQVELVALLGQLRP